MTDARWPTDADVARMRALYFADGPLISDVGIRVILEMLPPTLGEELRQELARPVPERGGNRQHLPPSAGVRLWRE